MKVFVIDQARCNGCHGCQLACKDEHCGNDWMPYQKAQPETGHFWMKVEQTTHGQTPKVKVEYKPIMCMHCDDPKCMLDDAVVKRDDGLVMIDPTKAEGRRDIMDACPYGVIYWNDEFNLPQKCDGCAHLVDAGEIPRCVDMCIPEAIRFGEEEDFADEIAQATQIIPEDGCRPRVYYLNAPGLFIGGEVWDPIDDEIIKGAVATLTGADGFEQKVESDHWGDFWFRNLVAGSYHLKIEKDGYKSEERDIELDKSLNIGDFPLMRTLRL
ncbi:MAG: carboxypeptidase regulatory-like domain-containing protein [Coriobacteriales bacterium]|nr:carboxypeptidase regulatory-like domain-containing protein [Coriobacteriales bacterium]